MWEDFDPTLHTFSAIYSTDPSCPYPSSIFLPSFLSFVFKNSERTIALLTADPLRVTELSRRLGWDAKQLQAQRRLFLSDKLDASMTNNVGLVVIDSVDVFEILDAKSIVEFICKCGVPCLITFSSLTNLTKALLHKSTLKVKVGFLQTGWTPDIHGYFRLDGKETLFRATDNSIVVIPKGTL
jgi:hypothetical protein